jgi:hypothetical protein
MFKELDKRELAARTIAGFLAGSLGTYINRVLVRIAEVWPVFHFDSLGPMRILLGQDWPLMAKACLIFGFVYAIFCMCVPRHLVPATLIFVGVLVLAGRAYVIDGLQIVNVYDDAGWIALHAAVRTALLLLVYWLARRFVVSRLSKPSANMMFGTAMARR